MLEVEPSDQDYLRQIELVAREVVHAAQNEGSLTYGSGPRNATTLQRAVNQLACHLRREHFAGDGCIEDDRPLQHLGGAAVISPSDDPAAQASYAAGCSRLGVEARAEGWALWYTWDDKARAHTMVTTALDTTRGLLKSWSRGHDLHPAQPLRAQIAAIVRGWPGPVILSPSHATTIGLTGR
ncbi:hypothetical protein GCM10020358_21710 [Amorphoplanes nipponensis]|uniref:Uncharacterized protein n=1 Tax=Actinoplanes nipponensis TaxID=135950 RepID=A0A919MSE4_9ACTN|nr:hypothetical protein [Actinoplanes nipponensis]GIE47990.1 hypothetical protein Ani05nite_15240 [Actinoplanes nipponensis]